MRFARETLWRALRRSLAIAGVVIAFLMVVPHLLLPWYARWGTTSEERQVALPGDAIVPAATTGYTLGITIQAPPDSVWPWLVQMGQGRGGFYTHTWVENLLGADIQNADRLVASLQSLAVGDTVRLTPDPYLGQPGQFMVVAETRRPSVLVFSQRLPSGGTATWAFALLPYEADGTRLLMRRRGVQPSLFDRLMTPGYVFMDRGVLQGVRDRAEAQ